MKKIFDNLYVFSKFALSFTLLICLIGTLYVLYINYHKESIMSQNELKFEEELRINIIKNSELIDLISKEIKLNKVMLDEIKKDTRSLSNEDINQDISTLNENIKSLNQNFKLLSNEIQILKNNEDILKTKKENDKPVIINSSKNDIIDLILIKYENNITFSQELEYLTKIISADKNANIEKINLLSNNPFKGHEYLKNKFNEEVNIYLKKTINTNPDSIFSKIILPYLEISPTSENMITNDLILKIKKINLHIENRNVESALKDIKSIDNYMNIFKLSSLEINKYLNFKSELYNLK